MFVGLTNIFNLTKPSRRLVMIITLILAVILSYSSFMIEEKYCVYTTTFLCHMETYQSMELAILNFMFIILLILYIILDTFGFVQDSIKGKESEQVMR